MLRRAAVAAAIVAVAVPLVATPAPAGRGSAIWVDSGSYRTADGLLHYGQTLTFGYRSTYYDAAGGSGPWLRLQCFRNGNLIFADSRAGFPGGNGYGEPFALGPSAAWTGGEADCKGILGHRTKGGKFRVDATTAFHAEA